MGGWSPWNTEHPLSPVMITAVPGLVHPLLLEPSVLPPGHSHLLTSSHWVFASDIGNISMYITLHQNTTFSDRLLWLLIIKIHLLRSVQDNSKHWCFRNKVVPEDVPFWSQKGGWSVVHKCRNQTGVDHYLRGKIGSANFLIDC